MATFFIISIATQRSALFAQSYLKSKTEHDAIEIFMVLTVYEWPYKDPALLYLIVASPPSPNPLTLYNTLTFLQNQVPFNTPVLPFCFPPDPDKLV